MVETTKVADSVRLDQLLFGYRRGHRLLTGSSRISDRDEEFLFPLTDVGFSGESRTFLSGTPLPDSSRYALFRSWPAGPELRPGSVWTHVLLIDSPDLARFSDLSPLLALFREPSARLDSFTRVLAIDLQRAGNEVRVADPVAPSLLGRLYGRPDERVVLQHGGPWEIEPVLMAIWSQQWPRLRREFSFRTGVRPLKRSAKSFDLQIVETSKLDREEAGPDSAWKSWLGVAVEDLSSSNHELRHYMRQFGAEAHGRSDFAIFCQAFGAQKDPVRGPKIIARVASDYPEPESMRRFKNEIAGPSRDRHLEAGRLVGLWQGDVLASYDPEELHLSSRLTKVWRTNRSDGDELLRQALDAQDQQKTDIAIRALVDALPPDELGQASNRHRGLIAPLLDSAPTLQTEPLFWSDLIPARSVEAVNALDALAAGLGENATGALRAVVASGNEHLLATWGQRSDQAFVGGLACLSKRTDLPSEVRSRWTKLVDEHQDVAVEWAGAQKKVSWPVLVLLADTLDPTRAVRVLKPGIWRPLMRRRDWLEDDVDSASYLLAVGFLTGGKKGSSLIAATFTPVDRSLGGGGITERGWSFIDRAIPLGKSKWDRSERLRRALVDDIVANNWGEELIGQALSENPDAQRRVRELLAKRKKTKGLIQTLKEIFTG